jgi:dynein light chain roadblock-type
MNRLSKKPGVVATIVLDKMTGSVLQRNSGIVSRSPFTESELSRDSKDENKSPLNKDVDEFSTMVWKFMSVAGGLVHDLDSEVCYIEIRMCSKAKLTLE